jgi:ribosome recycling factor
MLWRRRFEPALYKTAVNLRHAEAASSRFSSSQIASNRRLLNLWYRTIGVADCGSGKFGHTALTSSSSGLWLAIGKRYKHNKNARIRQHLDTLNEHAHQARHDEAVAKREKKKKNTGAKGTNQANQPEENYDDLVDEDEVAGEDDSEDSQLPDIKKVKERMQLVLEKYKNVLRTVRGAESSTEIFDQVKVNAYGSTESGSSGNQQQEMVPLTAVAQVVLSSPTRAVATCYDPSLAVAVRDAIQKQLQLNPQLDGEEGGGVVLIPLPRMSMETRTQTSHQLTKRTENYRLQIRNIRRKYMDTVKLGTSGKLEHISKDEAYRLQQDLEKLTDDMIHQLNDLYQKKHDSIMMG